MNRIALLGQPNSGKSTVFNQLTGSRQHVGNWPGKTVEKKDGTYTWNGQTYTVTDLPGSYGLSGNSDEEVITENYIKSGEADLVCVLVDASQLQRSMYMLAEFAELDTPAVLLLNMMDVAKMQNKEINAELLQEHLGIPVLPFTAAENKDYDALKTLFEKELASPHKLASVPVSAEGGEVSAQDKYDWIDKMLAGVTNSSTKTYVMSKLDQKMTRPVLGKLISLGFVLLAFIAAFIICMPFMMIGSMIPPLLNPPIANFLNSLHVHPWAVSVFSLIIPNTLYFSVSMAAFVFGVSTAFGYLEEIGMLARIAYQFDGILSKLGLQGKAVAPILMGFGCTIGGTTGTRVMDNWGQKMLAMAVVWAVPCGSIWAVMPVISGMFFPAWGTVLVCLGILLYMLVMMWIVAKVFGPKLSPESARAGMVMELPPVHKAHWGHILKEALYKAWDIFNRALRTVSLISLIFWALSYSSSGALEASLLYRIGTAIEPVTKIFGLGWRTFMGFLSSAFAKEAVLGVLNAIFVGQSSVLDATFNAKTVTMDAAALTGMMLQNVSKAEALAFIFACTFNVPCVMALSTTYRESHSLKWTARVAGFYIGSALILSGIVYHIASLFM